MNTAAIEGIALLFVFQCFLTITVRWAADHARDGAYGSPIAMWVMIASIIGKFGLLTLFIIHGLVFSWIVGVIAVSVFHYVSRGIAVGIERYLVSANGIVVVYLGSLVLMFVSYFIALNFYLGHW